MRDDESDTATTPPHADPDLILGFLRGDPSATRAIDGWIDVVLHDAVGSRPDEWDDLRQEIRTRVYRNLSLCRFEGRSALRTYVHRIAKNVCIDFLRGTRRRRELATRLVPEADARDADGDAAWAARDLATRLLEGLSDEDRMLVVLVFLEHRSYAEVAARLRVAEGTVKSRMFRCKNRILKRRREILDAGEKPR